MPRLPRLRGREIVAALRRAGFSVLRINGSHHFMRHPDGRATVVPVHSGETIGPGLFRRICRMSIWSRRNLPGFFERRIWRHRCREGYEFFKSLRQRKEDLEAARNVAGTAVAAAG
jgi:predicted RNA binding protein YcfA (HicA-like mRNA interferase family)